MTVDTDNEKNRCRISSDFKILRNSELFAGMNHKVVKLFAYLSPRRQYKAGDILLKQGANADQAFILVKGKIDITINHRDQEITLQQLSENSILGELCLLAPFQWFFSARAVTDLDVIIIERTVFQKVIEQYPEHKEQIVERVVQLRVNRVVEQTANILDRVLDRVTTADTGT